MGENPYAHNKEQEDLLQEQRYTIERITFIVEPRFKTEGKRSIYLSLCNTRLIANLSNRSRSTIGAVI